MAQMAAQDYFSRLQMSGMMHSDLANLSALGNLAQYPNASGSMNSSNSKNNLKRKDKMQAQQDSYENKKMSAKEVKRIVKKNLNICITNFNRFFFICRRCINQKIQTTINHSPMLQIYKKTLWPLLLLLILHMMRKC